MCVPDQMRGIRPVHDLHTLVWGLYERPSGRDAFSLIHPPLGMIATTNRSMLSGMALAMPAFPEPDEVRSQALEEKKEVESELTIAILGRCK